MGEQQQDDLDLEEGEIPDSPGTAGQPPLTQDIQDEPVEDEVYAPPPPELNQQLPKEDGKGVHKSPHDGSEPDIENAENPRKRPRMDKSKKDKKSSKSNKNKPSVHKYRNYEDELQAYIGAQKGFPNQDSDHGSYSSGSGENWEEDRPPTKKRKLPQQRDRPPKKYKGGNKKGGGPPQRQKREKFKSICKFYPEGKCFRGPDCTYAHIGVPVRRRELCKYYLAGSCYKGDHCNFMHGDFPCKFHHTGSTCYSGEENCKFSHAPLTEETKMILDRYLHNDRQQHHHNNNNNNNNEESSGGDRPQDDDSPNKRPSLLGSPPRHVKDAAGKWQQHMRDIQKNKTRPRTQFYADTLSSGNGGSQNTPPHDDGDCTPPYCDEDAWVEDMPPQQPIIAPDIVPQRSEPPPVWANNGEMWDMPPPIPPPVMVVPPPQPILEPAPAIDTLPPRTRELYQRIHLQQKDVGDLKPQPTQEDAWGANPSSDEDDEEADAKLSEKLRNVAPPTLDVNKILNVLGPNQTNNNFWNQLNSIVSAVHSTPQPPIFSPPPPLMPTPPPPFPPNIPPPFNASVPPPNFPLINIPPPPAELPDLATPPAVRDPRLTSRDPRNRDPRQQVRQEPAETPSPLVVNPPSTAMLPVVDIDGEINGMKWTQGSVIYKLREVTKAQINYFHYIMASYTDKQLAMDPRLAKRIQQTPKTLFPQSIAVCEENQEVKATVPPIVAPRPDPRLARLHTTSQQQLKDIPVITSPPLNSTPESPPELKKVEPVETHQEATSPPVLTEEDLKPTGLLRIKKKEMNTRKNTLTYTSPLSNCDAPNLSGGYNRRPPRPAVVAPQPAPPIPPTNMAVPTTTAKEFFRSTTPPVIVEPEIPFETAFIDNPEVCSLKDVFKNRDPTASPFC